MNSEISGFVACGYETAAMVEVKTQKACTILSVAQAYLCDFDVFVFVFPSLVCTLNFFRELYDNGIPFNSFIPPENTLGTLSVVASSEKTDNLDFSYFGKYAPISDNELGEYAHICGGGSFWCKDAAAMSEEITKRVKTHVKTAVITTYATLCHFTENVLLQAGGRVFASFDDSGTHATEPHLAHMIFNKAQPFYEKAVFYDSAFPETQTVSDFMGRKLTYSKDCLNR